MKLFVRVLVLAVFSGSLFAGERPSSKFGSLEGSAVETYKEIDGGKDLKVYIFSPEGHKASDERPAVVFFFGGGWVGGTPTQFAMQAKFLASRGMVAICADYRTRSSHKVRPFECVKDAKSCVRWVRANAGRLGIDPERIAAGGGSAGGHIAAATATVEGFDEDEDKSVSCVPDALVLFNPVFDNGPGGYGYNRVKDRYKEFSPIHNIREGLAPSLVMLGTKDRLIPVETAKKFKELAEKAGSRCDVKLYKEQPHGFFNYDRNKEMYGKTVADMEAFLVSIGYLEPKKGDVRSSKPNILIIFTDDQGYADLGCYGSTKTQTPRMDKLAEEGMRFLDFYAQTVCGPSRSALLTGRNPSLSRGWEMAGDEITWAELIKDAGYQTACIGKWDVSNRKETLDRMPLAQGFDYYFGALGANDNGRVTFHADG